MSATDANAKPEPPIRLFVFLYRTETRIGAIHIGSDCSRPIVLSLPLQPPRGDPSKDA